jgi:hypothetical protein
MTTRFVVLALWAVSAILGPWCPAASAFDVCAKTSGRGGNIKLRIPPCKSTEVKIGTFDGATLRFEGINVQVVSGGGTTSAANGRGNLIVGYNANLGAHNRNGSHNLVIGDEHTYSSYGGLVAGANNTISGTSASVTGGSGNTASGPTSSVTGGISNDASGDLSHVSGGDNNSAIGPQSCVTAGRDNMATGQWSAVSGGRDNRAGCASPPCPDAPGGGSHSAISGGHNNVVTGGDASISGGAVNTASGDESSVGGGIFNTSSGGAASVSGGHTRSATGNRDWVAGALFQDQ